MTGIAYTAGDTRGVSVIINPRTPVASEGQLKNGPGGAGNAVIPGLTPDKEGLMAQTMPPGRPREQQAHRGPAYRTRRVSFRSRRIIFARDDFTCQACGFRPEVIPTEYDGRYTIGGFNRDGKWVSLELDHVRPYVLGGRATLDNLQTLCNRCNARKGANV